MKNISIEITLDDSVILKAIEEVKSFMPENISDQEIRDFIQSAFFVIPKSSLKGIAVAFECEPLFLENLPLLKTGKISFYEMRDILKEKLKGERWASI